MHRNMSRGRLRRGLRKLKERRPFDDLVFLMSESWRCRSISMRKIIAVEIREGNEYVLLRSFMSELERSFTKRNSFEVRSGGESRTEGVGLTAE